MKEVQKVTQPPQGDKQLKPDLTSLLNLPVLDQIQIANQLSKRIDQVRSDSLINILKRFPSMELHRPDSSNSINMTQTFPATSHNDWSIIGQFTATLGCDLAQAGLTFNVHNIKIATEKDATVRCVLSPIPSIFNCLNDLNDMDGTDPAITAEELLPLLTK
jgi:hypothetical protein